MRLAPFILALVLFLSLSVSHSIRLLAEADTVSFNREIRPILSDRCYKCHGPDQASRKAGLRLDQPDAALAPLAEKPGWQIIKPGSLPQSELWRRINAADPDERMPPPESNLSLSLEEKDLLRRWIESGAPWEKHWAFIPPHQPAHPPVPNSAGPLNPIDSFILARLERENLPPSPPAAPATLLRRVTFDLTGLPPTLAALDEFLTDSSPDAYEHAVDKLLSSVAYAERMTMEWMDVARYADTHGYQADRYRPTWQWRDWVIQAFHKNMPFDDFIRWQIAGDLLPNATQKQILATAFNRLHRQTEEGGSVEEEFRVEYVADRAQTMATAFLGLTLECARCHDHKYDPISQENYYELFAFFNSVDESGQTSHFTDSIPVPTLLLTTEETDRKLAEANASIKEAERQIAHYQHKKKQSDLSTDLAFQDWLAALPAQMPAPGLVGAFSFDALKDGHFPNLAPGATAHAHPVDQPELTEDSVAGHSLLLSGENSVQLRGLGIFTRADPFSLSLWIKINQPQERAVLIHRTKAALDAGSRGYELYLENGRLSAGLTHMWPNNAIKLTTENPLPSGQWVHLTMTYDGSSQAGGVRLYVDGRPAPVAVIRDNLVKDILYERVEVPLAIGARFRDNGFKNGQVDEVQVFDRELTELQVALLSGRLTWPEAKNSREKPLLDQLFSLYLTTVDQNYQDLLTKLHDARKRQRDLVQPIPEIMVMRDLPTPRPTHVLHRGEYDQPQNQVQPGTPDSILPFDPDLPRNRLGLAEWLLSPNNPLTPRVTVNRYWQMLFGRGLVDTPEDFGSQGSMPTHPDLLDWLAADFRESGWDVRRLVKQIVTSRTYQQASWSNPKSASQDPQNRLLARGPRHRLQAEMIRDNALATAGLLVPVVGGPSVKPYQPEGLWEEKSGARYQQDTGPSLYRRSLYSFWKRTSPPPAMTIFDMSERNVCTVQREPTRTPMQALNLLNDPQYVEAARGLGERMLQEGGPTLPGQIHHLFRLITSRAPTAQQIALLADLFQEEYQRFQENPDQAADLLSVGEQPAASGLDPARAAAAAVVASCLLNYDETVTKR